MAVNATTTAGSQNSARRPPRATTGVEYDEAGQRERVLGMALDGLRARPR